MALSFFLLGFLCCLLATNAQMPNEQGLPGIQMPMEFQAMEDCPNSGPRDGNQIINCGLKSSGADQAPSLMRVSMKHRDSHSLHSKKTKVELIREAKMRDLYRLGLFGAKTLNQKLSMAPSPSLVGSLDSPPPLYQSSKAAPSPSSTSYSSENPPDSSPATSKSASASAITNSPAPTPFPEFIESDVESGTYLGSGEYFMDVYIGTPPKHFSLIIDTGSDLTWVQCHPCIKCYEQTGPIFSPNASSSYKALTCAEPECKLAYDLNNNLPCAADKLHTCRYSYWYGDSSNTTGELSMETITLSVANGQPYSINNIIFGCGHSNIGLFKGSAGLLGLGKGPLSFLSQLDDRYGNKFSYCLVNRYSNMSVSSVLTFGEDQGLTQHPDVQYTKLIRNTSIETFYYLAIKKVSVGGVDLDIPSMHWAIDEKGQGGTIIDSGTTLSYFVKPVYDKFVELFVSKVSYPRVENEYMDHCYNVSGLKEISFPAISIMFEDGAVFSPPLENFVIEVPAETPTMCLAIGSAPIESPSILGNFLQQNFHVLYDLDNYRLGFAPMACSS